MPGNSKYIYFLKTDTNDGLGSIVVQRRRRIYHRSKYKIKNENALLNVVRFVPADLCRPAKDLCRPAKDGFSFYYMLASTKFSRPGGHRSTVLERGPGPGQRLPKFNVTLRPGKRIFLISSCKRIPSEIRTCCFLKHFDNSQHRAYLSENLSYGSSWSHRIP